MSVEIATRIEVKQSTNLWIDWSQIAVIEVAAARAAHAEALASVTRGDGFVPGERQHALVAVVAAAFAVDAFYGATEAVCNVPPSTLERWAANKSGRAVRIFGTLHRGFKFDNRWAKAWRKEMGWLFTLRNRAAHHEPELLPSVYRPEFKSGFSSDDATYTAMAAERAAAFALDLIETCLRNPRSATREWTETRTHVADQFTALRAQLTP